jgi:hypothetical protein
VITQGIPIDPESRVAMTCPERPSPMLHSGERAASMMRCSSPPLLNPEDLPTPLTLRGGGDITEQPIDDIALPNQDAALSTIGSLER